jgi:hypothetical protein
MNLFLKKIVKTVPKWIESCTDSNGEVVGLLFLPDDLRSPSFLF